MSLNDVVLRLLLADRSTVDLTDDAQMRGNSEVTLSGGRRDEGSAMDPTRLRGVDLGNASRYSPSNPRSDLYGLIGRNTPIQLEVNGRVRATCEVVRWPQRSDVTGDDVWTPLQAAGISQRLGREEPLRSPIRRFYDSFSGVVAAYWPLEDDTDGNVASPAVDNALPIAYNVLQRPEFGSGDAPAGSAPLPGWPVLEAPFGWSTGGRLLTPGSPPYVLHCIFRLPPGTGAVTLMEWRTVGGTWDLWRLRAGPTAAALRVEGQDTDESGVADFTTSVKTGYDDGQWHRASILVNNPSGNTNVTLQLDPDDVGAFGQETDTSPGSIDRVRPRPVNDDPNDEPSGLGHVVVMVPAGQVARATTRRAQHAMPPISGGAGEPALVRVMRLCGEEQVPLRVAGVTIAAEDSFDRTVAGGWGAADTGQVWNPSPSSDAGAFSVDAGVGRIQTPSSTSDLQTIVLGLERADVDVRCILHRASGGSALTPHVFLRLQDEENYYLFKLDHDFDSGNAVLSLRLAIDDPHSPATPLGTLAEEIVEGDSGAEWWMRCVSIGSTLLGKVWLVGDSEPEQWHIAVEDSTWRAGRVAIGHRKGSAGGEGITEVRELTVSAPPVSPPMGPQRQANMLENLQDAADADGGMLLETRDELGFTFVPLSALGNVEPVAQLSYAGGDLSPPFHPDEDDRYIANDVTVTRPDGATARAVRRTGRLSTQPPPDGVGPGYRSRVQRRLHNDDQPHDVAGWLLHQGTWDEARYPQVRVDLRRIAELRGDTALAEALAALDPGDRVDVADLPDHLPPNAARLLVQGYDEVISRTRHEITFNTTPAGVLQVGGIAEPDGLVLSGDDGGYASTPDDDALDVTGDVVLFFDGILDNWSAPAFNTPLTTKYDPTDDNRAYRLYLLTDGTLQVRWSTDGTSTNSRALTTTVGPHEAGLVRDGGRLAIRAWLDTDDGDGDTACLFDTAPFTVGDELDADWVLFERVEASPTTSIAATASELAVGADPGGTSVISGRVFAAGVIDGNRTGPFVANPRFDEQPDGTESFQDAAGLTWTVHGSAAIAGRTPDEAVRYGPTDTRTDGAFEAGTDTDLQVLNHPGEEWDTTGYGLQLTGDSGDYASTPSGPAVDVGASFTIRALIRLDNWTDGEHRMIVARRATDELYYMSLASSDLPRLGWWDGGDANFETATEFPEPGEDGWLAIEGRLIADNGSGDHEVRFRTAPGLDGPWTQLGDEHVASGTTSVDAGDAPLEVGSRNEGNTQTWPGGVAAVEVWSGDPDDGGTLLANPDFTAEDGGTTSFTDGAGRGWTVHGDAAIAGGGELADPFDILTSGVRLRLTHARSTGGVGQLLRVQQTPVNGISKTVPAGSVVELWRPARYLP